MGVAGSSVGVLSVSGSCAGYVGVAPGGCVDSVASVSVVLENCVAYLRGAVV